MAGGDALNLLSDDLPRSTLAFVTGCKLGFADLARDFLPQVLLHLGHQDALGFLPRHVGDALKLSFLLAIALLELSLDIVRHALQFCKVAVATDEVLAVSVDAL